MIDNSIWDSLDEFTLDEAACLWCKTPVMRGGGLPPEVLAIRRMLESAIQSGSLPAIDTSYQVPFRRTDWSDFVGDCDTLPVPGEYRIRRDALKRWCIRNNRSPEFLFPEERDKSPDHRIQARFFLNIQRKKDGWADAIQDAANDFIAEHGKAPNEIQAWVRMLTNPPAGYGIANQDDMLTMPGENPLSKADFIDRWRAYTRKRP